MSEHRYIVGIGKATMIYKTKDLIKKNVPDCIEVNENEFLDFIKSDANLKHINDNRFVDMPPSIYEYRDDYYDEYNNLVAYRRRTDYEKDWIYCINPELRNLGIELKKQILDEYGEEYEKRSEFEVHPCSSLGRIE